MTAQWFGEYEIVKRLRVGGMATLHLARRHGAGGFSRLVALKMIHPHLVAQPSFIEMFIDEARICSHISHPNVVHVEEFGVLDGVHYLVMEYLDGCSASELLQVLRRERRMLDPELAARVIMQIAGGLHAAHETTGPDGQPLDVIHRDISPSNVLISVDGNAKLIDFGIAKARNRGSETQAGVTLKGKYRYVAPEQALHARVDRRCDIFSLGIVFWELLVGRRLFPDDTHLALLNRLYQTDVPAPSAANPAVPEAFDRVVLAMLQHDPADRPQTAAEVQRRIASAIPGAANREAAELGALAIEVRDKCEDRRARRANTESPGSDSHRSWSSSPRPRTSSEYRVEIGVTHSSGVRRTPPPVPPRWWRRRGVQIGAGLIGAGLIAGAWLVRPERSADGRASVAPMPPREREGVVPTPHDPVAAVKSPARCPTASPSSEPPPTTPSPTPASTSSEPPPAVPPPAVSPPAASPPAVSPPAVSPPAVSPPAASAPAASPPAASPPTPAHGPAAPPPAPAQKREVARVAPKRKPARPVASEVEGARPAPAPHMSKVVGAKTPFTAEQFDETANTSGAPAAPQVMKDKKAPIVPSFDN